MTTINFKIQKDKILSGEKKQTIREVKTDHWLRLHKGDLLHGYWKLRTAEQEPLFESPLTEDPFVIRWREFDNALMIEDGFKSVEEANRELFIPEYGKDGDIIPDKKFVVLRWR